VDVVTYHNDIARTGQNLNETVLTPANVNADDFGKIAFLPVDGKVDGQPLYLSISELPTGRTMWSSPLPNMTAVFAFDADSGEQLWRVSLLSAARRPATITVAARSIPNQRHLHSLDRPAARSKRRHLPGRHVERWIG